MSLDDLRAQLSARVSRTGTLSDAFSLEPLLAVLKRRSSGMGNPVVPRDMQQKLLTRFWEHQRLDSFAQARLAAFGFAEPVAAQGKCLLEDDSRYARALDEVVRLSPTPRLFRRCYQGLLSSYFAYDIERPTSTRNNWENLREFLGARAGELADGPITPTWVERMQAHPELLTAEPCGVLARNVNEDAGEYIDELRALLLIPGSSWFTRELFFGRMRAACELDDSAFVARIPSLLDSASSMPAYFDRALGIVVNRYVSGDDLPMHTGLRDQAVSRWGNPWLSGHETRWGHVTQQARERLGDWLKLEFIESFFTLLAEDGQSDKRRMNFWKRYVHSIESIRFVLGDEAHYSRNSDFSQLRKKAAGLTRRLIESAASNNAFIMQMRDVTIVEFSGAGNATYFYRNGELPFDHSLPMRSTVNATNSLKNRAHFLKLSHSDGIHGYATWEGMFSGNLSHHFGIAAPTTTTQRRSSTQAPRQDNTERDVASSQSRPTSPQESTPTKSESSSSTSATRQHPTTHWLAQRFRTDILQQFCEQNKLTVSDKRGMGGNLWINDAEVSSDVARVLQQWGFTYKNHKGWWRA